MVSNSDSSIPSSIPTRRKRRTRLHAGCGTDNEANRERLFATASATVKNRLVELSRPFGGGSGVDYLSYLDNTRKLYSEYVKLSLAAGDEEPTYMPEERANWVEAHMSPEARKELATDWPREDSSNEMLMDTLRWDRNELLEKESERLSCPHETMEPVYYAAYIQAMIGKKDPDFMWAPTQSGLSDEQETLVKDEWDRRPWLRERGRYYGLSAMSRQYAKSGNADKYRKAQDEMAGILQHDYFARPIEFGHSWQVATQLLSKGVSRATEVCPSACKHGNSDNRIDITPTSSDVQSGTDSFPK